MNEKNSMYDSFILKNLRPLLNRPFACFKIKLIRDVSQRHISIEFFRIHEKNINKELIKYYEAAKKIIKPVEIY